MHLDGFYVVLTATALNALGLSQFCSPATRRRGYRPPLRPPPDPFAIHNSPIIIPSHTRAVSFLTQPFRLNNDWTLIAAYFLQPWLLHLECYFLGNSIRLEINLRSLATACVFVHRFMSLRSTEFHYHEEKDDAYHHVLIVVTTNNFHFYNLHFLNSSWRIPI